MHRNLGSLFSFLRYSSSLSRYNSCLSLSTLFFFPIWVLVTLHGTDCCLVSRHNSSKKSRKLTMSHSLIPSFDHIPTLRYLVAFGCFSAFQTIILRVCCPQPNDVIRGRVVSMEATQP